MNCNDLGLSNALAKKPLAEYYVLEAKEDADKNGTVLVTIPNTDIELYAMMLSSKGVNIAAKKGDSLICKMADDVYSLFYVGNLGTDKDLNNLGEVNDLSKMFILQLGDNLIYGNRDGSKFVITTGDGQMNLTHETGETELEVSGMLKIIADNIAMNGAVAPILNAMTQSMFTGAPLISQVPQITVG